MGIRRVLAMIKSSRDYRLAKSKPNDFMPPIPLPNSLTPNPQHPTPNTQHPQFLLRLLQILLAVIAIGLIAAGSSIEYKVYDNPAQQFGLRSFTEVRAIQLVEDATFSGTIRIGDELFSTYNRAAPKGKMACPT